MKIKPTREECEIIRGCARVASGVGLVRLEPGERYNIDSGVGTDFTSINIALLTNKEHWDDTDLFTHRTWADFTRGFDATDDGRGIIDFYVSSVGVRAELKTNIVAYFEEGRLTHVRDVNEVALFTRRSIQL